MMKINGEEQRKPWKVRNALTGEVFRFADETAALWAAMQIEKATKIHTTPSFALHPGPHGDDS